MSTAKAVTQTGRSRGKIVLPEHPPMRLVADSAAKAGCHGQPSSVGRVSSTSKLCFTCLPLPEPRWPADHSPAETRELAELLRAPRFDHGRLGSVVQSLHAAVEAGPLEAMDLRYTSAKPGDYLADHSRNVAKLSMFIAKQRGYQPPTVRVVGLAALLHDVAMRELPREVIASPKPPEPDAAESLWNHPERGAQIVASTAGLGGLLRSVVPTIIRQHHERCDGSGYPLGLHRDRIGEIARILGIADSFEAMTSPRAYRKRWHPSRAMSQLLLDTYTKAREGIYDRKLVETFLRALSLYPVGCLVKLSSGQVARVVHSNPRMPKRPVVRPLLDANSERIQPDILDLAERDDITIARLWWAETDTDSR